MSDWHFDEHVAEQPDVVAGILGRIDVPALDPARPLIFAGIGSSLHAARIAAGWVDLLSGGRLRPPAVDAHDLALTGRLRPGDQVVVVSHRGTKRYPNAVLEHAAAAGATSIAVTGFSDARPAADHVLRTCHQERSSTHTVSYMAALATLAELVCACLGPDAEPLRTALAGVPGQMARTLGSPLPARPVDVLTADRGEPGIVAGTGLDAITAAEVALKLKEGTYRWIEGMHAEFALHGTPAVFRPGMPAFLIEPAGADGARLETLAGLLDRLGANVVHCGTDEQRAGLWFAPVPALVRPFVSALPFHLLVAAAARVLGANPDATHLDEEPWAGAFAGVTL